MQRYCPNRLTIPLTKNCVAKNSKKSLGVAYSWAIGGLFLGYWGAHRRYLGMSFSATALNVLLLGGILLLVYVNVDTIYTQSLGSISSFLSGSFDVSALDKVYAAQSAKSDTPTIIAYLMIASAMVWWVLDFFNMKNLVNEYNANNKDG